MITNIIYNIIYKFIYLLFYGNNCVFVHSSFYAYIEKPLLFTTSERFPHSPNKYRKKVETRYKTAAISPINVT